MLPIDTDVVDITQPKRSPMIQDFLATVQPGDTFAFFDLDGTVTKPTFDVEDYAVRTYLIPRQRLHGWAESVGWKGEGDFDYIYQNRHLTRAAYAPLTPELLYEAGKKTGIYAVEHGFLSPGAVEVITLCMKKSIRVVVLTASPRDLAKGLIDYLRASLHLPYEITVLGSEYEYAPDGSVTELTWMRGPNKTHVVATVKSKGVRVVLGAGDSPSYSDAFISICEIPVQVDQKDETEVMKAWHNAVDTLSK